MKLTVLQENLKNSVSLTSRFTSPKAQLPILGNILLKASNSKLTLSATNLETSITTSIGAKVEKEGEITVSGRTLNDIVSNLSSGSLELSVEKEQIKISSGSFKSNLLGANTNDFPTLPDKVGKNSFTLKKEELVNALSKTLFCVSLDETRPILTGVLFVFKKKTLYLVATDGFRLSEVKLKGEIDIDDFRIIIPKAVLHELIKINEEVDDVVLSYDKANNQIIFGMGETVLSSRIIEGEFPDYEKIIPKESVTSFNVDKNELEKAVKLASVFARDSGNVVKFKAKEDKLKILAESNSSGNQQMELETRPDDADSKVSEVNIMFNFRFIEEALKVIQNDELKIIIAPDNKASKFLDSSSPNFLHIIMPIKPN